MNPAYNRWLASTATLLVAALLLAILSACSDRDTQTTAVEDAATQQEPPSPTAAPRPVKLPRVLESFEVGNEVYVRSLAIDAKTAGLWVGTSTGVLEIDLATNGLRNTFTRADGLANEYVFAIFIDSQGYKWFGTNAGGVSRYRDGEWTVYFPMHGLADYWIYSFAEQQDGPLWIGTWAGANSVDLGTMKFTTYVKELINEWVYAIDIDSRERVWFGTEGGISLFDGKTWRHWTHADGLGAPNTDDLPASPNTGLGTRSRHDLGVLLQGSETYNPNYVFSLIVDNQDRVWAGTWGGGIGVFDGQQWRNYTTRDGLAGNIVYCMARDADGVFWFGTNRGLTRYDGTAWHTYNHSNGLLEDNVYAIATTAGGDIWVGTKRGVTRIGLQP
ncbi:MAG: regulator [Gammaproteobacteria bacterium]|nr:regulator [Gammaproteobacteria bacterium]